LVMIRLVWLRCRRASAGSLPNRGHRSRSLTGRRACGACGPAGTGSSTRSTRNSGVVQVDHVARLL